MVTFPGHSNIPCGTHRPYICRTEREESIPTNIGSMGPVTKSVRMTKLQAVTKTSLPLMYMLSRVGPSVGGVRPENHHDQHQKKSPAEEAEGQQRKGIAIAGWVDPD